MKYAAIINRVKYGFASDPAQEYKEFKEFNSKEGMLAWIDKNHNVVTYTIIRFENVSVKPDFKVE